MDYAFERDWQKLRKLMEERFGEDPDITTMIFAVGLQECGQGYRKFKKDDKVDIMHVGICTLHVARAVRSLRGGRPNPGRLAPLRAP